jgi:hypothetical protein
VLILAGFNLAQDEIVKPENARKTALNAHNVHLTVHRGKSCARLALNSAHKYGTLKVPRIIFETNTGHRRHKWRIRSVDHSSCYAMTLSALMYLLCALKYTKVYKKIFVQKSLQ